MSFRTVAVVARRKRSDIVESLLVTEKVLKNLKLSIVFEDDTAAFLKDDGQVRETLPRSDLATRCDVIVVVGGDGSLLGVARDLAPAQVPLLGVNRGGLGFLAGVSPEQLEAQLTDILHGQYASEEHFLLQAQVIREGEVIAQSTALNDVVVHPGSMAHMMEFGLWVNQDYVYDQRSEGVIIASPTGSTAYSLSAGGPIMHPSLDAIVIVPMFPHTLTSRPLVVRGDAEIKLKVTAAPKTAPRVSWDSQVNTKLRLHDEVRISKYAKPLTLLYPTGYDYFESCRSKLDWASRLSRSPSPD